MSLTINQITYMTMVHMLKRIGISTKTGQITCPIKIYADDDNHPIRIIEYHDWEDPETLSKISKLWHENILNYTQDLLYKQDVVDLNPICQHFGINYNNFSKICHEICDELVQKFDFAIENNMTLIPRELVALAFKDPVLKDRLSMPGDRDQCLLDLIVAYLNLDMYNKYVKQILVELDV